MVRIVFFTWQVNSCVWDHSLHHMYSCGNDRNILVWIPESDQEATAAYEEHLRGNKDATSNTRTFLKRVGANDAWSSDEDEWTTRLQGIILNVRTGRLPWATGLSWLVTTSLDIWRHAFVIVEPTCWVSRQIMRVTKLGERRLKHAHGERYECSRVKRNRKQVLTVKECSHRENGHST